MGITDGEQFPFIPVSQQSPAKFRFTACDGPLSHVGDDAGESGARPFAERLFASTSRERVLQPMNARLKASVTPWHREGYWAMTFFGTYAQPSKWLVSPLPPQHLKSKPKDLFRIQGSCFELPIVRATEFQFVWRDPQVFQIMKLHFPLPKAHSKP